MTATVHVQAFHNVEPLAMLFGYEPGHRVRRAFTAQMPAADPYDVCEAVFILLNGGDLAAGRDQRAQEYRRRGERSLSKGDLVAISDSAHSRPVYYSVDSAGFTPLAAAPRILGAPAEPAASPR